MAFIPPQGNQTVMVDNSNNIVYPASFQKVVATQATIAGNNFTDVPSVIDPENATTTQLPSVASIVNYVADVVEGGSSGLIPAIQSDIQTLGQVKSNRGAFWFEGGLATVSNMSMNNSWSLCCRIRMQNAQVQSASIFHLDAFYLYWNTRLGIYCNPAISSVNQVSVDDNNRLANGEWHSLVVSYDGTTLKLTDETGILLSIATSEQIYISGNLLIGEAGYNGQIADVKYFNFDMSDANAPYTIADYISGKDESPVLNQPNPTQDWHSMPTGFSRDASTGKITMTNTSTVNSYPFELGTLKPGVLYKIKVNGSILNPSRVDGIRLYLPTNSYTMIRTNITTGETTTTEYTQNVAYLFRTNGNEWDVEITFVCDANSTNDNTHLRTDAVDTSRENYFYFSAEKIGTLLSLDDYSIKVGATQIVPDVSSNNNDATITGVVYGSKDNSIAKMAQLFYQSQQG